MKKIILIAFLVTFGAASFAQTISDKAYNKLYKKTEKKLRKDLKKEKRKSKGQYKQFAPEEWWIQQYMATMDPALGRPTPETMIDYLLNIPNAGNNATVLPGTQANPWVERGPNNVGGRTRALAWDPIYTNKAWAGGVTGGLWYNTNVTSSTTTWVQVSSLWSNLNVTAIAFDPNALGTIYVGTGEGFGTTASTSRGTGLWKSTDSGQTFAQITNTKTWYYINDIVIRDKNGTSEVYVAVDANSYRGDFHGLSTYGLKRSTNGGTSWSTVGPKLGSTTMSVSDMEIGLDNRIWIGTRRFPYSGTDRGGSRVLYSDNGSTWTTSYTATDKVGRVSIGVAQSDSNYIYALIEKSGKLEDIMRSTNRGSSWTSRTEPEDADNGIPDTDFTRGQAWYDLVIAVDPNDKDVVIAGGVDLFRSTNGASTWTQISKWSNNENLNTLSCPLVHADQHAIVFKKGSSSTVLFGNDGGVFYSSAISTAGNTSSAIAERNKGYNVTQFYWGDIANGSGSNNLLAGAQDNGTQKFTAAGINSTTRVKSGDGAYCFIDKTSTSKQVASYVYNQYEYTLNNWSSKATLIADGSSSNGAFINCAEWDNNESGLITNKDGGNLYRIKLSTSPGSLETKSYTSADVAMAIKAFKLSNGKSRVWVGNNKGKLFVTDDFWATTPSFTDKTSSINSGSISDILNWNSGDTVFVTLSNYGVNNIYYSSNKGTSWTAKDGNLPNMPVWSIVLNPNNPSEAVIGTETGIFATTNIFATSPVWTEYTEGMGNVKIATLKVRDTDNEILAVTHGRGLFTSSAFEAKTPATDFSADLVTVCSDDTISMTDVSLYDPTSWAWSFVPYGNVSYVAGTDSTSQNPKVLLKGGSYKVILKATNSTGTKTKEKAAYIMTTDTFTPKISANSTFGMLCDGDNITVFRSYQDVDSTDITKTYWSDGTTLTSFTGASVMIGVKPGVSYQLIAITDHVCALKDSFLSNTVNPKVRNNTAIAISIKDKPLSVCVGDALDLEATATNRTSNSNIEWFVNNISIGTGLTKSVAIPVDGHSVKAVLTESGVCITPSNSVQDSTSMKVNPKPAKPSIRLSWDTLYATYTGTGTIKWHRNNVEVGTGDILKLTANGYYVAYLDNGACLGDSSSGISFNALNTTILNASGISVYPNPVNREINISSAFNLTQVSITGIDGKHILSQQMDGREAKILLPEISAGSIIVTLTKLSGEKVRRVVLVNQ